MGIEQLNLIQAGEPLNGTGNEGAGQPDTLNRPIKELVSLMEAGQLNVYATKISVKLVDNNDFDVGVISEDVVTSNYLTGKYGLAIPSQVTVIGFADLTESIIHVIGIKEFTGYTFVPGKFYYLSKTLPGKIVPETSADRSFVVVGVAITSSSLFVKIGADLEVADSSAAMAIALGG